MIQAGVNRLLVHAKNLFYNLLFKKIVRVNINPGYMNKVHMHFSYTQEAFEDTKGKSKSVKRFFFFFFFFLIKVLAIERRYRRNTKRLPTR